MPDDIYETEAKRMKCTPLFALVNACEKFCKHNAWLDGDTNRVEFYEALITKAAYEFINELDAKRPLYSEVCRKVAAFRADAKAAK